MEAFTLNDQNGDGFITHNEYRKSNPNMPEMDSKTIFSNFDQDKDGRISRTEFKSQVQHNTPKPEGKIPHCKFETKAKYFPKNN